MARAAAETGSGDSVAAPLPGILRAVAVTPGEAVEAGAVLAVMEAMKMEHSLTAPRAGTVAEVMAAPGDSVAEGAVLIALEPET
jgi:3-methylcrotonyl-CoA carboxylase alpha subunit